jgi:hypothetical protein
VIIGSFPHSIESTRIDQIEGIPAPSRNWYIQRMMKKTRVLILALILVCGASRSFAAAKGSGLAIGGEGALYFGGTGGLPMAAMLMLHLPQFPLMFGVGVTNAPAFGLTADYWAAHGTITSIFAWYFGVGGYLSVDLGSTTSLTAGARIPIGLQAWPVGNVLEIFLEAAPAVGIVLVPTGFEWHIQGAIGLRFWL